MIELLEMMLFILYIYFFVSTSPIVLVVTFCFCFVLGFGFYIHGYNIATKDYLRGEKFFRMTCKDNYNDVVEFAEAGGKITAQVRMQWLDNN